MKIHSRNAHGMLGRRAVAAGAIFAFAIAAAGGAPRAQAPAPGAGNSATATAAAGGPASAPSAGTTASTPSATSAAAATAIVPQWQIDAGGKMEFDVASVKQNQATPGPDTVSSNIPLGPMDAFTPVGGLFRATNWPLRQYFVFAYKFTAKQVDSMQAQLPKWANENRYDIEGHASGNPTKDQFRLMMQALLADRFKLAMHREIKQVSVMALVYDKGGKPGPHLRAHADQPGDAPCTTTDAGQGGAMPTVAGGFPVQCGVISFMANPSPGVFRIGARNLSMDMLTGVLTGRGLITTDKVLVNGTDLRMVDFVLEFSPQQSDPGNTDTSNGPSLLEALKEQLGLKLESRTGPEETIVIDHIEQPGEN